MSEPRFHHAARSLSVREIAEFAKIDLTEGVAADRQVTGIAALDHAGPDDLTFCDNARYSRHLATTQAGVCLAGPRFADGVPAGTVALVTRYPFRAFVTAAVTLFPDAMRPASLFRAKGVSEGAHVSPAAMLEPGVRVDPGAVIGPDAEVGAGTVIAAGATVGPGVRIGRHCSIGAGATVTHALIGDRVIVHAGVRIGQDGFGYLMGPRGHGKVPQVGRVIVQDDVEIGANTCIDRGANRDTVIGEGTKIDNLVQIAHNVSIGRHCVIVAQSGLSGSTTLGDFVALGARVGTNNHVTIGDGAQIAAMSIVTHSVPAGKRWGGFPARPIGLWLREIKLLDNMVRGAVRKSASDAEGDPEEQ